MPLCLSSAFRCNQSDVVAGIIIRLARLRRARSLLDIGAGDGAVAVRIAQSVERYLAVEQDPSRAEALRDAGLEVKEAIFPIPIEEKFDLVVASQSLPEHDFDRYEAFLSQAWNLVSTGGTLLLITFKGSETSPMQRLSEQLCGVKYGTDDRFSPMLRLLVTYGDVHISRESSFVESPEFSDMAAFFGHWFWRNEEQEKIYKPLLRNALDTAAFRTAEGYRIAMHHLCITVDKAATAAQSSSDMTASNVQSRPRVCHM
jgi:SAM-dependent methyltransferase